MTPEFAAVVGPLTLKLLKLLDASERPKSALRQEVKTAISDAEEKCRHIRSEEWEFAKYALIVWFDEEMIKLHQPWEDAPLEFELLGERGEGGEKFFSEAQRADEENCTNALEVYFLCFLMGFRGIYQPGSAFRIPKELPPTQTAWQMEVAKRLGKKRYKPPEEWPDVLPRPRVSEPSYLTGSQELTSTSLFFAVSLALLAVALLAPRLQELLSR